MSWKLIDHAKPPQRDVFLYFPETASGRNSKLQRMVVVGRVDSYPFRKPTHYMPIPAFPKDISDVV